jgi:hypothetical protein
VAGESGLPRLQECLTNVFVLRELRWLASLVLK